ncbi:MULTISPECIES: FG-GAP repeat domain-containing protein [Pseudoalteromonas]|uniref:FG-GAP repeat protein n=1 Tax=Pseudoalteromonas luteoviolacea (strain 2ta16) TaxID=1353533 RepID=V4I0H6_PSEL2|nr:MULTISPECIES: VCBS repeat-containing protein [Pseudoalteromonas]ESP93729.1 hypothetical protein PL2TA16_02933 [Pseudoalteromonas luteoviolacea 2ta16]KZN41156.1 hypothetical protein N483_16220 [Pseudoalteromonas luteoviolacea NCIMB 1944]MCG7551761.1 VCBS repeat-containing protein [Pseudoalteromonas sp. Of7M-16]
MRHFNKTALTVLMTSILSGCGGGSDSSNAGSNTNQTQQVENTVSDLLRNPEGASKSELKNTIKKLISTRYTGNEADAALTGSLVKQTFKHLFDSTVDSLAGTNFDNISTQTNSNGIIRGSANCYISGTSSFVGKLDEQGKGHIVVDYTNCKNYENTPTLSGSITTVVTAFANTGYDISFYFNKLTGESDDKKQTLSGYFTTQSSNVNNSSNQTLTLEHNMLFEQADGKQFISSFSATSTEENGFVDNLTTQGSITYSEEGKVQFKTSPLIGRAPYFSEGSIEFTGASQRVELLFSEPLTTYYLDRDNDGTHDEGTYFRDFYSIFLDPSLAIKTTSIDNMSLPPLVHTPHFTQDRYDTTTPITVQSGSYEDPDTELNELEIGFRWYINGDVIENQSSDTLPAGIAKSGDSVTVAMLVSDGANQTLSNKALAYIEDAPISVSTVEMPAFATPGDVVTFTALELDPDTPETAKPAKLVSAPNGVTIDENGTITWVVPTDSMFSSQTYYFNFEIPDPSSTENQSTTTEYSITVNGGGNLPLARSGTHTPIQGNNITIGDFDGDGNNEVLTTDNLDRIMLLSHQSEDFEQTWLYPYKMPTQGTIQQVIAYDSNHDGKPEIYVLTKNGLSVIEDLNSEAKALLSFEDVAKSAAIADTNGDGQPEFAVIHGEEYNDDSSHLSVYSQSDLNAPIFNASLPKMNMLEFGNVDSDNNLELIINNGVVYDSKNWENQWLHSGSFGSTLLELGDLDGDGVQEIVGSDWEFVRVYSALTNSQLGELKSSDICSINTHNIDTDKHDELLIGPCQWGNIEVYNIDETGTFSSAQTIFNQETNTKSIHVGDSDNDGSLEVLWSSNSNSSANNILSVADVNANGIETRTDLVSPYLSNYVPAGWNQKNESIFYAAYQAGNLSDRGSIISMDSSGDYSTKELDSFEYWNNRMAQVASFNDNGLDQVLISTSDSYDTGLSIFDFETSSISYQLPVDSESTLSAIETIDADGDNVSDALYSVGTNFTVVDVFNQNLIATYALDQQLHDFSANYSNGLSVVLSDSSLQVIELDNGSFFSTASYPIECLQVEYFNYDSDENKEIICLGHGSYNFTYNLQISIFKENNGTLELVHEQAAPLNTTAIAISPTSTTSQNIIYVTSYNSWYGDSKSQIIYADSKGNKLWASPELIGSTSKHKLKTRMSEDGKLQLLFSTTSAMFQLN